MPILKAILEHILGNARLYLYGIAIAAIFAAGMSLERLFANIHETKALTALESKLNGECAETISTTEEMNDALQKDYDAIAKRVSAKRVLLPTCTPVAGSNIPAAGGREYAGSHGLSTQWLREFAGECERYRQERIALENNIREISR